MKKLLVILFLMFGAACSRENAEDIPDVRPGAAVYTLPVDLALENLKAALEGCNGPESRAVVGEREVFSVETLHAEDLYPDTRSGSILSQVSDLLYFVRFQNGAGSAILGADTRIGSIYAILDRTVWTPEDFKSLETNDADEAGELRRYIVAALKQAVLDDFNPEAPPVAVSLAYAARTRKFEPAPSRIIVKSNEKIHSPICKTKWGQGQPYNNYCLTENGYLAHAGCVAVAIGQIMAAQQNPTTIKGEPIDWTLLKECNYGGTYSAEARDEAARFIYRIGTGVGIEYSKGKYVAKLSPAYSFLKSNGYSSAEITAYQPYRRSIVSWMVNQFLYVDAILHSKRDMLGFWMVAINMIM